MAGNEEYTRLRIPTPKTGREGKTLSVGREIMEEHNLKSKNVSGRGGSVPGRQRKREIVRN